MELGAAWLIFLFFHYVPKDELLMAILFALPLAGVIVATVQIIFNGKETV